jgi:hypothetical protein
VIGNELSFLVFAFHLYQLLINLHVILCIFFLLFSYVMFSGLNLGLGNVVADSPAQNTMSSMAA